MKLINPTDDQLNAAFAEKVAGWVNQGRAKGVPALEHRWVLPDRSIRSFGKLCPPMNFTSSADAVLPWLEKFTWRGCSYRAGDHYFAEAEITLNGAKQISVVSRKSLADAAVIALLRSKGVEIEFT